MKLYLCYVNYHARDDVPLGIHKLMINLTKDGPVYVICRNEDRPRHAAQKALDSFLQSVQQYTKGTLKIPMSALSIEVQTLRESGLDVYKARDIDHQKTEIFSVLSDATVVKEA